MSPSTSYWFDSTPLNGGKAPRLLSKLKKSQEVEGAPLTAFAEVNGLTHLGLAPSRWDMRSLVLDAHVSDVIEAKGQPEVEFGNSGWRYWVGDGFRPSRRGYIAVRHGLDLSRVAVTSGTMGQASILNAASLAIEFAGMFNWETPTERTSWEEFNASGEKVELPGLAKDLGFSVRAKKGEAEQAAKLFTPEITPLVSELAKSFDLEVSGEWLMAYSYFGDVATTDPEVWAWVFSNASRLLDLAGLWRGDPSYGQAHPFYTPQSISRPTKLDGELRFLKKLKKSN